MAQNSQDFSRLLGCPNFYSLYFGADYFFFQGNSLPAYFSIPPSLPGQTPYNYVLDNSLLRIDVASVYNIFITTPFGNQANGSLWTLIYEWQCYLLIAIFLSFGLKKYPRVVLPILLVTFGLIAYLVDNNSNILESLSPSLLLDKATFIFGMGFLAGACIAAFSELIPSSIFLAVLCGVTVVLTLEFGKFHFIGVPAFAYLIFFISGILPASIKKIGQKNDYSFGIYIYGYLVQQTLALLGIYKFGLVPYVFCSFVITFGFAWLSWNYIEKKCMALKNRGLGLGINYWMRRFQLLRTNA